VKAWQEGESGIKTGLEVEGKPSKEEENLEAEGRQVNDTEIQTEDNVKLVEKVTSVKSEENQPEEEEIDSEEKEMEGEGREAEDNAAEQKEGSERFVEIDDEQFEVIDNMDEEDSDVDFKDVTVPSPAYENDDVRKQLLTDSPVCQHNFNVQTKTEDGEDDYIVVTRHSAAHDQVYGQLIAHSTYYQSGCSACSFSSWLSTAEGSHATLARTGADHW